MAPYDDGAVTLFLYTKGKRISESPELEKLLNYIEHTDRRNAANGDLQTIQKMVDSVKQSREAKRADMKFHEWINWERKEARREALAEGRTESRAEGRTEGLSEGKILGVIETMRDDGKDDEEIISRLVTKYNLRRDEAESYMNRVISV